MVASYSSAGVKSASKPSLDKNIFGLEVKNHGLLSDAYNSYLANGRANLAKVKTRGEVIGSTKKPWKQKGTGRARFGSKYNPIWRGGGITFGPTGNENYTKKINTKAKRLAVRQALSLSANSGKLKLIDGFEGKEGKVRKTAALLKKIDASGRVLLVVDKKDELVLRATNNINNLEVVTAKYLNVFNILNADTVIITKKSLDTLSEWLLDKPNKVKSEAKS